MSHIRVYAQVNAYIQAYIFLILSYNFDYMINKSLHDMFLVNCNLLN